ncbi:hypothetical protein QZH41_012984, partial [Actinostola sp. cb2023]
MKQDHYRVLGLTTLRYKATANQVKKAYKKKVLKHHPDKKKSGGEPRNKLVTNEDYFMCITKANDTLSNRNRRRAYDSVDSTFDDDVPPMNNNNKANFFEVFDSVIETNARWSNLEPVPLLGHENSTFDEVDRFYSFWYDFDSWREFSYLDEEEKEKGENRDERRWIEKQNKAMRQKRKKEEVTRIRTLVDNMYACDPRIKKFKDEEKDRKLAEKKAKEEAVKAVAEEKLKKQQEQQEAERLAKEKEEHEVKQKAASAKKEKDKLKAAMKKERKTIRTNHNYFCEDETTRLEEMNNLDVLLESLSLEHLQTFREDIEKNETIEQVQAVYQQQMEALKERRKQDEVNQKAAAVRSKKQSEQREEKDNQWTIEQTQLLVKAVNLFPAGTVSRWRVIADYVNDHCKTGKVREPKHVIKKVKGLQKSDISLKDECNKNAFSKFESTYATPSSGESVPTVRYDAEAKNQPAVTEKSWSSNEQKLLEEALRKFPANTPERWDRIADSIPDRTKKDCMKRYK